MRYAIINKKITPIERETQCYLWIDGKRWQKEENQRYATRQISKDSSRSRIELVNECDLKSTQERLDADRVVEYLRKELLHSYHKPFRDKHPDTQIVEIGRILGVIQSDIKE
jgi:hypothetical protein